MAVVVAVIDTGGGATGSRHTEMSTKPDQHCFANEWKRFVERNSGIAFQISLLITADAEAAAAALTASVNDLNVSRQPTSGDLQIWKDATVKLSVAAQAPASHEKDVPPSALLQPGLQPLLRLDRVPRICFVLRVLLGYSIERCANILGVHESDIPALVAEAAVQLQQTVAAEPRALSTVPSR